MNSRNASIKKRSIQLAVALAFSVFTTYSQAATTFSLSGNWSNTENPSGPWSYRQGTTLLPLVKDWTAAGSFDDCDQPAWAPSNTSGNFIPALFKPNTCSINDLDGRSNNTKNVLAGDIVTHTVDSANGNTADGSANFLFTLPAGDSGTYVISGSVWDAGLDQGTTRPQDWALLVNGVTKASGTLSGDLPRSKAATFSVSAALTAGETVELVLSKDSQSTYGYFVGTNMTLTLVPPACELKDALAYDAATEELTMTFTLGTPVAATWRGWLVESTGIESLWTQSLAVTEPAVTKTEKESVAKSGVVGILSTLSTTSAGITCSSLQTIQTGQP